MRREERAEDGFVLVRGGCVYLRVKDFFPPFSLRCPLFGSVSL